MFCFFCTRVYPYQAVGRAGDVSWCVRCTFRFLSCSVPQGREVETTLLGFQLEGVCSSMSVFCCVEGRVVTHLSSLYALLSCECVGLNDTDDSPAVGTISPGGPKTTA